MGAEIVMSITITENVNSTLDALEDKLAKPPIKQIGQVVLEGAQARIRRGGPGPEGQAWKPTRNRSNGMLYLSGALSRSLRVIESDGAATVGSDLVYAKIQAEGGKTRAHLIRSKNGVLRFPGRGGMAFAKAVQHPGSNIPARPIVGIGTGEKDKIDTTLDKHLPKDQ